MCRVSEMIALEIDARQRLFQPRRMNAEPTQIFSLKGMSGRAVIPWGVLTATLMYTLPVLRGAESKSEPAWRSLPLITDGKVDPNWVHTGWGGFVVDDGALRTECDPKGLGLLVYKKERLGNCQIRVVFKAKDERSNSGVYVRIADGILEQVGKPGAAFDRDAAGKISEESMEKMQASAKREEGPWFAVHRGYEVQIAGGGDPFHGTGSIYSLAPTKPVPSKAGEWRTMTITLAGERIFVDLDEQRVTSFDSTALNLPPQKQWHEPKREPKRPEAGYLGLQNHDPGDVVWFKEISVRPLPSAGGK
jgi:3-keto-disaccharide hydrolase